MGASPLTRSVAWREGDRSYTLSLQGDTVELTRDGEPLVALGLEEWNGVRAGLSELARFRQRVVGKPTVDRSTPEAPSNGQPWSEELDVQLAQAWYAGDGLAALARRFGRTEGSIASRLARLDIVGDCDEARKRP